MLSQFYWDPNPQAFTIPYFDRPVMWYGVCWVVGFFCAYRIMIPLLARKLQNLPYILSRDIENWSTLFQILQTSQLPEILEIRKLLSHNERKELDALGISYKGQDSLKNAVLEALNAYLKNNPGTDRATLEILFPKTFFTTRALGTYLSDLLLWYSIIGAVVGARLGHVLFYDLPKYAHNPLDALKVWEGGLASHGGAIGVIIALLIYVRVIRKNYPEFNFITILDLIVVPTAFVAFCIRIGNFINQEILGTATSMPWGIIFGHPADGSAPIARHPVQLYEAAVNLILFFGLYTLWKTRGETLRKGYLSGVFFIVVFGSRIAFEYFKAPLSLLIDESTFSMGQYLSIPFLLLGVTLLAKWKKTQLNF